MRKTAIVPVLSLGLKKPCGFPLPQRENMLGVAGPRRRLMDTWEVVAVDPS